MLTRLVIAALLWVPALGHAPVQAAGFGIQPQCGPAQALAAAKTTGVGIYDQIPGNSRHSRFVGTQIRANKTVWVGVMVSNRTCEVAATVTIERHTRDWCLYVPYGPTCKPR